MATKTTKAAPPPKKPAGKASVPAEVKKSNVPTAANVAALPEHMRGDAGKGTENLGTGDYEMPRIKLIQAVGDEIQTYDGLKVGDFFHTALERSLGSELQIVPLYISKRYVLWRPRPPVDLGGILARADDGVHWSPPNTEFMVKIDKKGTAVKWTTKDTVAKSGLAEWGTYDPSDPQSQPAATLCYVVVAGLPEHQDVGPVALLLQRSAVKPARKLMGKLKISRAPIYGMVFDMSSYIENGASGDFGAYRFQSAGFVEDPELYETYKGYHEQFARTGVQVKDLEDAQDEGGPDAGGGNAADETRY